MTGIGDYYLTGVAVILTAFSAYCAFVVLYRFIAEDLITDKTTYSLTEAFGILVWFMILTFSIPVVLGWVILTLV